jgi:transposase-like protein
MMNEHGVEKTVEDLGVSKSSLTNWSKKASPEKPSRPKSLEDALKELKSVQKENQYLKKINEVLKKITPIFSQDEFPPFK